MLDMTAILLFSSFDGQLKIKIRLALLTHKNKKLGRKPEVATIFYLMEN